MAEPTFAELLAGCKRSALHLEMRDGYMLNSPTFLAWKSGHRADPSKRECWWRPFLDQIASAVERGAVVRRARVVSEPISDYVRFEYDTTFTNVAAGEEVRWLPRRQASDLALPGNDFWLFDDTTVLFNHFDGNGNPTARDISTDPAVVKLCASAFEAVWDRGTSHSEYQPT